MIRRKRLAGEDSERISSAFARQEKEARLLLSCSKRVMLLPHEQYSAGLSDCQAVALFFATGEEHGESSLRSLFPEDLPRRFAFIIFQLGIGAPR